MNLVIQTCTLGGDPVRKTYGTDNDKVMATWSGAVKKNFAKEGESDTNWFQYTAFGSTAEFVLKYFKKGSKMLLRGTIDNNNYTNNEGNKVYGVKITVDSVEFAGAKPAGDGSGNTDNAANNSTANNATASANAASSSTGFDSYDDF